MNFVVFDFLKNQPLYIMPKNRNYIYTVAEKIEFFFIMNIFSPKMSSF